MKPFEKAKTIFSVGGGKGGVGKSIFSVALGAALAKDGLSVALLDLDLGAANLHTYLGITKKTPTIADFILRKVPSLEEILIDTSRPNLKLVSGSEFIPGMANPAHWMKLKIMRHIKSLPVDIIIIDLGAGVHFNTLDFFGMSNRGIVLTAPEPAAVMNAYSFIKGALFRKLQSIFKKHPDIGPIIESESKKPDDEKQFTLGWFTEKIREHSPDMLPLVHEIEKEFNPSLIVNKCPEDQTPMLIKNLISLCSEKLGVNLEHTGNIPDIPGIYNYLLDIPGFLYTNTGKPYLDSISRIKEKYVRTAVPADHGIETMVELSDDQVEEIINLMETLDDSYFIGTNRNSWKLKMYFKPLEVIDFLISRGVKHDAFTNREGNS